MNLYLAPFLCLLLVGSSEQIQPHIASTAGDSQCSGAYIPVGDRCVHVNFLTTGSWVEMREYCKQLGGDLVVLHDANFFMDLITYIHSFGWQDIDYWVGGTVKGWHDIDFWVGGAGEGREKVWMWVDGTPIKMGTPFWGFTFFGQAPLISSYDDCAMMEDTFFLYLNDRKCADMAAPICQQK